MVSTDLGALGFWLFIAAIVVAGIWEKSRREAERHETLRRIVEKTGSLDEAKLKDLFEEKPTRERKPGAGYRALRIIGTIIMFIGAVPAIFGIASGLFGGEGGLASAPPGFAVGMLATAACIVMLGLGLFYSSRFAEPPPGNRNEPPAR
jgi:hypothetical protein